MRLALTDRQATILCCGLAIAAADQHNLDWLNRVLKGSKHKEPTNKLEVDELWRYLQHSQGIEIEVPKDAPVVSLNYNAPDEERSS